MPETPSPEARQDSPGVTLPPPLVFYSCLLAGIALELTVPLELLFADSGAGHGALSGETSSGTWTLFAGCVLGGFGFLFMMFGHELFKRRGTSERTWLPATELVTDGAYRFSRNPMYVGGSAFYLGMGLASGSLWMLLSYLPLGLYLALYMVPREEAYMRRTFGDQYQAYCARVRRWL